MNNRNQFSQRFAKRKSEDLAAMVNEHTFEDDARIAAIWELENRNEATSEQILTKEKLIEKNALIDNKRFEVSKYQTFGSRFMAAIIDGFVLVPISFLVTYITDFNDLFFDFLYPLLDTVTIYAYSILMHGYRGQTLGKMAMDIKVVNNKDESKISYCQAFKRDMIPLILIVTILTIEWIQLWSSGEFTSGLWSFALATVGFFPFLWTLTEVLSMLLNDKSRAVHDFIAKTVVIKTKYS